MIGFFVIVLSIFLGLVVMVLIVMTTLLLILLFMKHIGEPIMRKLDL